MKLSKHIRLRHLRAFSLLEMVFSIAILAILLALALSNYTRSQAIRYLDSDWRELGSILLLAKTQSMSMGSGSTVTPSGSGVGVVPTVFFSYDPNASPRPTCEVAFATSSTSSSPLEVVTLDPGVVLSTTSPASTSTADAVAMSATFFPGSPSPVQVSPAGVIASANGSTVMKIFVCSNNATGFPPHTIMVDLTSGGVTEIQ